MSMAYYLNFRAELALPSFLIQITPLELIFSFRLRPWISFSIIDQLKKNPLKMRLNQILFLGYQRLNGANDVPIGENVVCSF